jgi:carbon storage regulator
MLVLSRKEGERLMIGDNITLVVSRICGNRVSIGIEAPQGVKIMRAEIVDHQNASESTMVNDNQPVRLQGLREFAGSVLSMKRQVG